MGIRRKEAASLLFSTVSSFFSCGKCEGEEEEAVGKCLPEGDLAARRRYRLPPPTKPGPQPIAEEKEEEESGVTFLAILSGSGKTDVIAVTEKLALEYRVSFDFKASMRLQKKIACLLAVSCAVMQRSAQTQNCVHFPPDFLLVSFASRSADLRILLLPYITHARISQHIFVSFVTALNSHICRATKVSKNQIHFPSPLFRCFNTMAGRWGETVVCVFVPLFSLGGHTTPLPSQVSQGKLGNSSFLPFSLFPAEKKGGGSNLAALLHTATEATPGTGFDIFRQGLQQKNSPIPMKCCVSL